ncbi:MFS transporter [Bacillus swezeyi]|uniref:MFS transporter n=1 Tax=Bacillus swezeyi TaxID=1925020 RepID=A0A1R1QFG6_9BACI|nr:MFS transporter [Bacillus swezeyi]MEC1262547.1 MFS transporter [Bacillus swezeyi]MED2926744.1 MFS transporter [Bacillus swezeyi]MED2943477.1 MFS transporter [Bacillus swezeyi]MED2965694.1 MFS transporter [Bacillus swezeyi]MED2978384.1 MFS transporter [Bacillus swezeyi]
MKNSWIFKGDFFKLWSGTFLSLLSSTLFYYSLIWWSLNETDSALSGSLIIGLGMGISIALSPITGWLADRFHRGRIIAFSDMMISVLFFIIGLLAIFNFTSVLLLFFARALISIGLAAIQPASRSLISDTVEKDLIEKGVAFQEVLNQVTQVIVPILTGILFTFLPFGYVWFLCGCLTFISIFLEFFIKDRRGSQKEVTFSRKELFTGFINLFNNKPLRNLLYGTSIQQLLFSGFPIYIAIWTSLLIKDKEWVGGVFQSIWGMGTLLAAITLSFLAKQEHLKIVAPALMIIFGLLLAPLGWIKNVFIGLTLFVITGAISGIVNIYLEGFLQRVTEGSDRGRSLGAFFAVNSSLMPLGYALAGMISEIIDENFLFLIVALPTPLVSFFIFRSVQIWEGKVKKSYETEKAPPL